MAQTRSRLSISLACVAAVWGATPTWGDGFAGGYLAGRAAGAESDFEAASRYFTQALVQDPANVGLMENAMLAFLSNGDFDRALAITRRLESVGQTNQVANMLQLAEDVRDADYADAFSMLEEGETVSPLIDGLTLAWIEVGEGNMSEALGSFDQLAQESGLQSFAMFHKALALSLVGDFEGADEILSGETGVPIPPTRNGVIAHAEVLSQLERNEDALKLIEDVFGTDLDPTLLDIRARLEANETLPLSAVKSPQDGVAEVFFTVAGALVGETSDEYTLVYTRISEFLRPDNADNTLLTARLLENLGRYELANDVYNKILPDDPAFLMAELGRANALRRSDKPEAAIEVLTQLTKTHPEQPAVYVDLGDLYRGMDEFEDAAAAYDKAVALYDEPDITQWPVYFSRGIAYERIDQFDKAELDFRKALELNPGQPQVLNYLGYSFVELQINLDEALEMIEEAVKARPDDGYITDSLGWVYYRLGRYEEAVEEMERAAELTPVDPVINDHLGDVYWAVGRKREAEFQWNRAMSFKPTEEDAARIRRKLEVGLDEVLKEEGADPIAVANDG